MIRALLRLLGLARRGLTLLAILALLTTNVLAFTSSAFVGAVSAAAGAVGVQTVQAARQARVSRIAGRLRGRMQRMAARSVAGGWTQSVPFAGAAAVVALTALELKDACDTMQDAAELDGAGDGASETVCGIEAPTLDQVSAALR